MKNFAPTFSKSTLLLAPDAILTINQNIELPVCKDCGASSNIVDLVTRMNVSLSLESAPGTASFDLAIPKHSTSQIYNKGGNIDIPIMSEVNIYMKGRFSEGAPKYYRVFWGLVTSVEMTYSDGFYAIHVECADMLKWWDLSVVTTQDSVYNAIATNRAFRALSNIYSNLTAPEIIYALGKAMFADSTVLYQTPTGGNPNEVNAIVQMQIQTFNDAQSYWKKRFEKVGISEIRVPNLNQFRKKALDDYFKVASEGGTEALKSAQSVLFNTKNYDPIQLSNGFFEDPDAKALPMYSETASNQDPFSLGIDTALGIANKVKERINYEFFMDTGGIITFKPPYYNASTKGTKEYRIEDSDLLSYHISHNLDNIYTRVQVEGSYWHASEASKRPSVFYVDPIKSKQYGIRQHEVQYSYVRDVKQIFVLAVSELNRLNTKEKTGTIDILGRPELRLGVPVYLACEDAYVYVKTISHQFDFGQSFTTSIGFDTVRSQATGANKQAEIATPIGEQKTVEAALQVQAIATRGEGQLRKELNEGQYFRSWKDSISKEKRPKSASLANMLLDEKEKGRYSDYETFIKTTHSDLLSQLKILKSDLETQKIEKTLNALFDRWKNTTKSKIKSLGDFKNKANQAELKKFKEFLQKNFKAAVNFLDTKLPPPGNPNAAVAGTVVSAPSAQANTQEAVQVAGVKVNLNATDKDGYEFVLGFAYGYTTGTNANHLALPPEVKFSSQGQPGVAVPNAPSGTSCTCGS